MLYEGAPLPILSTWVGGRKEVDARLEPRGRRYVKAPLVRWVQHCVRACIRRSPLQGDSRVQGRVLEQNEQRAVAGGGRYVEFAAAPCGGGEMQLGVEEPISTMVRQELDAMIV